MQNVVVDGATVGRTKQVTQVQYLEILGAGHYLWVDKKDVMVKLLQDFVQRAVGVEQNLRHEEAIII
jgi:hypothetical protein